MMIKGMDMIPHEQVNQWARCLFSRGDIVELRAIAPGGKIDKAWVVAESLKDEYGRLSALNAQGYNIYAGANPRDKVGASGDDHVIACRTLFADFDGCGWQSVSTVITNVGLPIPTLVVNSGHGVHTYWRLTQPIEPTRWKVLQQRLIATVGSDPAIKNPERIMRLPGFLNVKSEPYVECCLSQTSNGRVRYDLAEIEPQLKALLQPKQEQKQAAGAAPVSLAVKGRARLYAAKWPGVGEGQRSNAAYAHSCSLVKDFDLSDGEALDIIREWNALNLPALDDRELASILASAKQHGKHAPGVLSTATRPDKSPKAEPKAVTTPLPADSLKQVIEDIISGKRSVVDLPWPNLNDLTQALMSGTVTILCGSKGATKTFFLLDAMTHLIESGKAATAMLVLEEDIEHCLRRFVAQRSAVSNITIDKWVKEHPEESRQIIADHTEFLAGMGANLWDCPTSEMSLSEITTWITDRIKDNYRVIIVDPITAASQCREPWIHEPTFINQVKRVAREANVSIVLATHPKKGSSSLVDMDSMAGSSGYSRFAQTVLWLEAHDDKDVMITGDYGRMQQQCNRTIHILAARNAMGRGRRIAFDFSSESLTFHERGPILPKNKGHQQDE